MGPETSASPDPESGKVHNFRLARPRVGRGPQLPPRPTPSRAKSTTSASSDPGSGGPTISASPDSASGGTAIPAAFAFASRRSDLTHRIGEELRQAGRRNYSAWELVSPT